MLMSVTLALQHDFIPLSYRTLVSIFRYVRPTLLPTDRFQAAPHRTGFLKCSHTFSPTWLKPCSHGTETEACSKLFSPHD